jgi:hypothetical protein
MPQYFDVHVFYNRKNGYSVPVKLDERTTDQSYDDDDIIKRAVELGRLDSDESAQVDTVDTNAIKKVIDMPALLTAHRDEDEGATVWAVYNRIQEKIIKGGWQKICQKDEISRRVRPVTGIALDVQINKDLWKMAEEYASI